MLEFETVHAWNHASSWKHPKDKAVQDAVAGYTLLNKCWLVEE